MFLLDTDHVALLHHKESVECQRLVRRMESHPDKSIFYPVIAFHEQMLGANVYIARARRRATLSAVTKCSIAY